MHRLATPILATTVITPEWLNSVQEEIANVIEYSNVALKRKTTDTMDQLLNRMSIWPEVNEYDIVVSTQAQFNSLFTRTGANAYNIKSNYKSILLRNLSGGYLCYGATSFLSGGDTYSVISTNLCSHIVCESGAYLNIGATAGYVLVNTDDCRLDNAWVQGSGVSGSIFRCFLLGANRVLYSNCKVSGILTTETFAGFVRSGTLLHNLTSKYVNCQVFNIHNETGTKSVFGFYECHNLSNCSVYTLHTSTNAVLLFGFYYCHNLTNCGCNDFDSLNVAATCFYYCNRLSSCFATDIASDSGNVIGMDHCSIISSCSIANLSSNSGGAYGYTVNTMLSSCYATNINGFSASMGFLLNTYMASCYTDEVVNDTNDYVCSLDVNVTHKESTPQVFT